MHTITVKIWKSDTPKTGILRKSDVSQSPDFFPYYLYMYIIMITCNMFHRKTSENRNLGLVLGGFCFQSFYCVIKFTCSLYMRNRKSRFSAGRFKHLVNLRWPEHFPKLLSTSIVYHKKIPLYKHESEYNVLTLVLLYLTMKTVTEINVEINFKVAVWSSG